MMLLAAVAPAVVITIMSLVGLALIVMVCADTAAAWPPPPRHAAPRRTPGAQYWVRSVEVDTAPIVVAERRAA